MVDLSKMTKWDMGKLFDFSVLPKQSTEADIRRGCQIAKEYNCKAFCFSSSEWTPIVAEELKGTDIMVGAAFLLVMNLFDITFECTCTHY